MFLKSIIKKNVTVGLRHDGIMEIVPNPHYRGNEGIEEVKQTVCSLDELSQDVSDFLVLAALPDRVMTKEARDYISKPDINRLPDAVAILAANKFQQMLGNMIIFFSSPEISQTRLFSCKKEALSWLRSKKKIDFNNVDFNLMCRPNGCNFKGSLF